MVTASIDTIAFGLGLAATSGADLTTANDIASSF